MELYTISIELLHTSYPLSSQYHYNNIYFRSLSYSINHCIHINSIQYLTSFITLTTLYKIHKHINKHINKHQQTSTQLPHYSYHFVICLLLYPIIQSITILQITSNHITTHHYTSLHNSYFYILFIHNTSNHFL